VWIVHHNRSFLHEGIFLTGQRNVLIFESVHLALILVSESNFNGILTCAIKLPPFQNLCEHILPIGNPTNNTVIYNLQRIPSNKKHAPDPSRVYSKFPRNPFNQAVSGPLREIDSYMVINLRLGRPREPNIKTRN
jgi:hypothetical protein